MLAFAKERKVHFDGGEPFTSHNLESAEQATTLIEAAQKEVDDVESEVSKKCQLRPLRGTCQSLNRDAYLWAYSVFE